MGSWVVLPEPVSPATTTTWFSRMADMMSPRRAETGRLSGYTMRGVVMGSVMTTVQSTGLPRHTQGRAFPRR